MAAEPQSDFAQLEDDRTPDAFLERRLELERERQELMNRRARTDMLHSAPVYPEFWLEKFLNLTGLRARGEANA
ncbi:MAG: hypothetical protein U9Q79_05300, partial [Candidatus Hydrogenedentes bacterium]|nr:hypothetical protein [Candidatus Hydrogenedentota bacterium]